MELEEIIQGKTKIVFRTPDPNVVLIKSKDDITAGDGDRRDVIEDKAILATTTTANSFRLLTSKNVPNHFIRQVGATTFEARNVLMIALELVVRRVATGSYLKRRPDVAEGLVLPYVAEFFQKDDANHDPLVVYDFVSERVLYFDPKQPLANGFLREEPLVDPIRVCHQTLVMKSLALQTFKVLEEAWANLDVTLVDLKIECGVTAEGETIVADVLDGDSCRLWPGGNKALMVDKQVYRDLRESTPEALRSIKKNYSWIAEKTQLFLAAT